MCFVRTPEVARLTQVMLKRATRRFLLADRTKAGGHGYVKYGALSDFDLWITTVGITAKLSTIYEKMTTVRATDGSKQQD